MPTIDLSDEELQGLIMLCAQGSGPGITWMLTNAILTKAQAATQASPPAAKRSRGNSVDHLQGELDATIPGRP